MPIRPRSTTNVGRDVPLLEERLGGNRERIDAGAFRNATPRNIESTANALALTASDIDQAKKRREAEAEQVRRNSVKGALLKAKLATNEFVDRNRQEAESDPQAYRGLRDKYLKEFRKNFDTSQFGEQDLLQLELQTQDSFRPELNRRQDNFTKLQDNQFESSVRESTDITAENASRYGQGLATAQEDDLPDLVNANDRNEAELEDLLRQTKADGTPLFTPEQAESMRDELQFRNWSQFGIALADRGAGYAKVAQAIEKNNLAIPVSDGKGGVIAIPIRDYIKDPKVIDAITAEIRAEGKRVKADRELDARLDVGADYFWGRELYNSHDADSKKALEAYEEISYSAFTQAPALDGNNARSDDPEFDGKSKVDIAVPFLVSNGKLPNRIRGWYDSALQTGNVEAWDSAGAIYKQAQALNKYSDYDIFDDAQENNVISYNHLRATGVSGDDAIKRILERRDRHEIAPAITKQLRTEWNKKVDPINIGDSFVELDDFGDDNISDRRSQVAILQFKNRANVIGRNEFIDRQDRGTAKEIGIKDARKAFGFTNITGKKTFMELPPEIQPAFAGLDPKDLALKEQLNTRIQNGIERLDKDILPENMADNIVLQVDSELLTTSLNEDGRVPYRLYLTDANGMMHDITNADGNTDNPMLFSSKYAVEKASERTAKAIKKAEAKRENVIASEVEADDIGDI